MPGILDIIDIFLVALLLYGTYRLMKNSGAQNIFIGVFSFLALWVVVCYVIKLKLFGAILDKVVSVGAIALIVLFQKEIRQFLVMLGSRGQWSRFFRLFSTGTDRGKRADDYLPQLVMACKNMSDTKTGALIVLERRADLEAYAQTGERVDARVSSRLVENIFFKNTPLHDGALILTQGRIKAAACILPLSEDMDMPKAYGLRHRSALGIAQATDAVAIVVSEETGQIALAYQGCIFGHLSVHELEQQLIRLMASPGEKADRQIRKVARKAGDVHRKIRRQTPSKAPSQAPSQAPSESPSAESENPGNQSE